tara:strand:- start:1882 stop:2748 length:867 start_codon:yes stop_codon:yes gene_type:complete
MSKNGPVVLFFDIETLPLKTFIWQPGTQYVGHKNLLPSHSMWGLICIQYAVNDGPVKVLRYDKHGGTAGMIEAFDKLVAKSDIVLGKNSDRFDIKMLNSMRALLDIPPIVGWEKYTEDLEKQMRRYFRLPSQSLDYISKQLGVGGKVSMEMSDWIAISNYRELTDLKDSGLDTKAINIVSKHLFKENTKDIRILGKAALEKMCHYGAKDTEDTRILWNYLKSHFDPKFNVAKWKEEKHGCKHCGNTNIKKNGIRVAGKTRYQQFYCNDCGMYAGRSPISKKGVLGQIG